MGKKDQVKKKKAAKDGQVPGTYENQNLGHNSKKEGLGPNTGR
jgi:hypothetical protein